MSIQNSEPERLVRRLFKVNQSFVLPGGEFEFQVAYADDTKSKFVELKIQVAPLGFRPELTGRREECVLVLRKIEPPSKKLPRLPAFVALSTAVVLAVSALLRWLEVYQQLIPSLPSYVSLFGFGATIALILGIHELSQRLVGRSRDAGQRNSYLIPGIPFVPPYLPSLGYAGTQRNPALNRDSLFDAIVVGPLSMLAFAAVFYVVGDLTQIQSSVTFQSTLLANSTVTINSNAIQLLVDRFLGPYLRPIPAGYVPVSPLADGATIGFILVFFGLLPIASYDGGFLAAIAWGGGAARAAGYLSVLALLTLDTPFYWVVGIMAFLLVGRPYRLKFLDEVSGLSTSRQWLFIGTLVLAFLCLPIPRNLGTLPLP